MFENSRRWGRKPVLLTLAAVIAAAAFFSSGMLVARATDDGDDDKAKQAAVVPSRSSTGLNTAGGFGGGSSGAPASGEDASLSIYPGGCPAPLGDVIGDGKIDPSKSGLEMKLLGSGFTLQGISLRAEGACEEGTSTATKGEPVLDTMWIHNETKLQVYVSQRGDSGTVANYIDAFSATFTSGKYTFTANVNGYTYLATDLPATGGSEPAPDSPVSSQPGGDPRAAEVLQQAIKQLAPDFNQQCFNKETIGGWEMLGQLGIGDPRPAIPAGYELESVQVHTIAGAADGCEGAELEGGNWFNAGFVKRDASGMSSYLSLNANALQSGETNLPGRLDSYGVTWTNAKYRFAAYVKDPDGASVELLQAIAKAMDPSFNSQCLATEKPLSAAELTAAGFRAPATPSGYSLTESVLVAVSVSGECEGADAAPSEYRLNWSFVGQDGTNIQANTLWQEAVEHPDPQGWIYEFGLNWSDARGVNYGVSASTVGVSGTPDRNVLIAIAKSMDPTLDPSKLSEEKSGAGSSPGSRGPTVPSPAPVED